MVQVGLYLVAVFLGFVFQTILSGHTRMFSDLFIGFLTGITVSVFSNFVLIAFSIGIFLKMAISGYFHCSVMMIIYIVAGLLIGYLVF